MDTSDLRSEGDKCDDAENDFATALECPIARDTLHRLLKEKNCIPDGMDAPAGRYTHISSSDIERPSTLEFLEAKYNATIRETDPVWYVTASEELHPYTGATIPTSAFLFAAAMVLLFHVSGKCLTVIMPSSQMGIPGTSLTIRRALRLLMDESHYSVRNLLTDMSDVARSLGSIAAEYGP